MFFQKALTPATLYHKPFIHLEYNLQHILDILPHYLLSKLSKKVFLISLDEQLFYPTDTAFSVSLSTGQSYQIETYQNYQTNRNNSWNRTIRQNQLPSRHNPKPKGLCMTLQLCLFILQLYFGIHYLQVKQSGKTEHSFHGLKEFTQW